MTKERKENIALMAKVARLIRKGFIYDSTFGLKYTIKTTTGEGFEINQFYKGNAVSPTCFFITFEELILREDSLS